MDSWRKLLGNELKAFRKARRWTQTDVATKTGIKRPVISDIENGKFIGAISTLERYMLLAQIDLKPVKIGFDFPQLDQLDEVFKDDDD